MAGIKNSEQALDIPLLNGAADVAIDGIRVVGPGGIPVSSVVGPRGIPVAVILGPNGVPVAGVVGPDAISGILGTSVVGVAAPIGRGHKVEQFAPDMRQQQSKIVLQLASLMVAFCLFLTILIVGTLSVMEDYDVAPKIIVIAGALFSVVILYFMLLKCMKMKGFITSYCP